MQKSTTNRIETYELQTVNELIKDFGARMKTAYEKHRESNTGRAIEILINNFAKDIQNTVAGCTRIDPCIKTLDEAEAAIIETANSNQPSLDHLAEKLKETKMNLKDMLVNILIDDGCKNPNDKKFLLDLIIENFSRIDSPTGINISMLKKIFIFVLGEKGINQTKYADLTGVSKQTISDILRQNRICKRPQSESLRTKITMQTVKWIIETCKELKEVF